MFQLIKHQLIDSLTQIIVYFYIAQTFGSNNFAEYAWSDGHFSLKIGKIAPEDNTQTFLDVNVC